MSNRNINEQSTINPNMASVNALKYKFITSMELAGMGPKSRKRYLFSIEHPVYQRRSGPAPGN